MKKGEFYKVCRVPGAEKVNGLYPMRVEKQKGYIDEEKGIGIHKGKQWFGTDLATGLNFTTFGYSRRKDLVEDDYLMERLEITRKEARYQTYIKEFNELKEAYESGQEK